MLKTISNTSLDELAADRGIQYFDTALPQDWFDAFIRNVGTNPRGHIVWSYDMWLTGHPQAIDYIGDRLIGMYAAVVRS